MIFVNEKNRLLMLGIITIIVVSIVLIGITYAFFSANVKGNEKATQTVVETANLKLVFIDTELIDIENALPGISTSKNFSVENKGNSALYYNINIINVLNEFISDDLVYKITSDDGGGEKEGTLPDDNSTLINEILINPGEIHTYTIQIIFRETGEDQNQNQGARFKGKLQISTQSMYSESVVFGISEPMGQVIKGLNKKINIVGVNYGQLNCLSENETIATCSTEDEEINILGKEVGTTTIKIVEDIENKEVEYIMNVITVKSEFSYTGNYQEFTAALSGNYMIELWGANSGTYKGSYVKGTAYIEEGTKLYFYVGGANSDTTGVTGGYNGGGTGGSVINTSGGTNHCGTNYRNGGGGATDVRTISGVWNDTSSLNSRIIVASGAGATANGDTDGANSTASMSGVSITRQPGGGKHTGEAGLGGTGSYHHKFLLFIS